MKNFPHICILLVAMSLLSTNTIDAQVDSLKISVGKTILNKSLWAKPYKYESKDYKALTVQITITSKSKKNTPVNFNDFALLDEGPKLRIRPNAVAYYRADKKIYHKSKVANKNYDTFKDTSEEGYRNFQASTYPTNFFGRRKRKIKASVKSLKKVTIKKRKKATYYIDFPVGASFSYGKILYKGTQVGFAAVSK